jgi:tetratricopeptide (TPR) repeat protein
MKYLVYLILICLPVITYSQEKRIALVIGNANYEKAPLKNPVNDAILMKHTFVNLGFDVILDTNIETRKDFYQKISEFEKLRENYSVGFVYYAGHAVQIDGVNYMLATKESYDSEADVKYNGLDVGIFMNQYIDPIQNEINVLILDACRNNPFEKNWITGTRSINNSAGLAEIKNAPSGSLIAFSTAAGATASDGNDKGINSTYCMSLSKNMQLEGITLNKVFGNVRREVRESTGQYPAIYDQLEGRDFFLKKSNFFTEIEVIDSLIEKNDFDLAREKTTVILTIDPMNKKALLRKARIEYNTVGELYQATEINKAIQLYPLDPEGYEYMARYYSTIGRTKEAVIEINKAIKLDSLEPNYFLWRAIFQEEIGNSDDALNDYSRTINLDLNNPEYYAARGTFYQDIKKNYDDALKDFSKAIELAPNSIDYWYSRGALYQQYLINLKYAIEDFEHVLLLDPTNIDAINSIGVIYESQKKLDLAIAQYERGIELEESSPTSAAFCYSNRAFIYAEQGKLDYALKDYSRSVELDPFNPERYNGRALFFQDYKGDYNSALIDFSKAIELAPYNIGLWQNRASLYSNYIKDYLKALENYEEILKIDSMNIDAINSIGIIYEQLGDLDQAIEQYGKGILLEKNNPQSSAFCYSNRAIIFSKKGKLNDALKDYSKAIELDPKNPDRFSTRGLFYQEFKSEYENALKDFSKAIELNRNSIDHWFNRGVLYKEYLNNDKKALDDFEQVLRIEPSNIDAINWIGVIYREQNKPELAIEQYDKGIALEKNAPESAAFCFSNRAEIFSEQGKLEEALQDYSNAIVLDPKNSNRFANRGLFFQNYFEDYNNALIDLSKAIEIDPSNIIHWYNRGILYQEFLKNDTKALDDFEKVLEIDSNDIDSRNWIGSIYKAQDKLELALEQFDRGILLEDSNPVSAALCYSNRALLFSEQGKIDKALNDYTKAIQLDKENAERYYDRGIFLQEYKQDYKGALLDLTKAIDLDGGAAYYFNRSKIFSRLSDIKSRDKDLETAIKIAPDITEYQCVRLMLSFTEINALNEIENLYKSDSTNYNILLYKTKIELNKGEFLEALNTLERVIKIEPNDPEPYYIQGKIYDELGKTINAAINFTLAQTKLESGSYYITDDFGDVLDRSKFHAIIGKFYEKIGERELMCEEYKKANELLKKEFRPHLLELKKDMEIKSQNCN